MINTNDCAEVLAKMVGGKHNLRGCSRGLYEHWNKNIESAPSNYFVMIMRVLTADKYGIGRKVSQ